MTILPRNTAGANYSSVCYWHSHYNYHYVVLCVISCDCNVPSLVSSSVLYSLYKRLYTLCTLQTGSDYEITLEKLIVVTISLFSGANLLSSFAIFSRQSQIYLLVVYLLVPSRQ